MAKIQVPSTTQQVGVPTVNVAPTHVDRAGSTLLAEAAKTFSGIAEYQKEKSRLAAAQTLEEEKRRVFQNVHNFIERGVGSLSKDYTPDMFLQDARKEVNKQLLKSKIPFKDWKNVTGLVETRLKDVGQQHFFTADDGIKMVYDEISGELRPIVAPGSNITDQQLATKLKYLPERMKGYVAERFKKNPTTAQELLDGLYQNLFDAENINIASQRAENLNTIQKYNTKPLFFQQAFVPKVQEHINTITQDVLLNGTSPDVAIGILDGTIDETINQLAETALKAGYNLPDLKKDIEGYIATSKNYIQAVSKVGRDSDEAKRLSAKQKLEWLQLLEGVSPAERIVLSEPKLLELGQKAFVSELFMDRVEEVAPQFYKQIIDRVERPSNEDLTVQRLSSTESNEEYKVELQRAVYDIAQLVDPKKVRSTYIDPEFLLKRLNALKDNPFYGVLKEENPNQFNKLNSLIETFERRLNKR